MLKKPDALWTRARMLRAMRDFFIGMDYLEVETPNLIPAPIPEKYIDTIPCGNMFLHTSPELYMKRLLAAGYPRIFQICKCYREGERGSCHLPEFTMLEWYCRGADYRLLMEECEKLIISVAHSLGNEEVIHYQGKKIKLQGPWENISVREAFTRYAPVSMEDAVKKNSFDEVMVGYIESHLGWEQPTFIYDYPVSGSALAKAKKDEPAIEERFELYIGGQEIANACSELIETDEHHARFKKVEEYRHSIGKPVYPVPRFLLQDNKVIPESAGIALGVDRLAMIFCNSPIIDNVVTFTPELL
ncbi:MAG TPA: EF-P lysine aminoacylase EpmA [Syntrophales bacterium]|nr:EF-P lysine aminoacylase EpmA [Syntrophales bacterium]